MAEVDFHDVCENSLIFVSTFLGAMLALSEVLASIKHVRSNSISQLVTSSFRRRELFIKSSTSHENEENKEPLIHDIETGSSSN